MSAQVANANTVASTSNDVSGPSYAHAVLNLKNDNSNKENINETEVNDGGINVKTVKNATNNTDNAQTQLEDEDNDSFTPVVSHSRKERKNNERKRKTANRESAGGRHHVNGGGEKKNDKKEAENKESQQQKELGDKDANDVKRVFVEAPLPKVNPWQVKQNSSQVLTANSNSENRILKPQRQSSAVNGDNSNNPGRFKDKKRNGQRVSVIFFYFRVRPA